MNSILKDSSGNVSSMRVAMLLTLIVVLGSWAWISIQQQQLQPLDSNVMMLVLGSVGGKIWQKNIEEKNGKQ